MKSFQSFSPPPDSSKKLFDPDSIIFPDESQININFNNSLSFQKKQKFYIATKINAHSPLLGRSSKLSASLRKTIREEEEEENELFERDKEKNLKENSHNIFQLRKGFNENMFNELNSGPRYGEKGKVIPYSIVGKPENFVKLQNSNKMRGMVQKNPLEELKTPRNSNKIKLHNLGNSNISLSRKPSLKSVNSDKTKDLNVTYKSKFIRTNKETLLKELEEFERRTYKNVEIERANLERLLFNEKMFLTQDQRKMDIFEQKRSQWTKDLEKICNSTDKSLNQTVMLQFDDYRRNKEKVEELEKLKEALDKKPKHNQNDYFWYFSLRNYPEDDLNKITFKNHEKCKKVLSPVQFKNIGRFTLLQDLPNGFKIGVVNSEKTRETEKIREPFIKRLKLNGTFGNSNLLLTERNSKKSGEISKSFEKKEIDNSNFNILLENSLQDNRFVDEIEDLEVF